MFGKYTPDSIEDISAQRTQDATKVIGDAGGKVVSGYALLGETDLVLIAEFPGNEQAMKASVGLARLLEISFTTSPAVKRIKGPSNPRR
jgi:uncharacterized protein with GYD domain